MATLLDGVNDVLKRVQIIKGENGELTSLTRDEIQHEIDVTMMMWNEVIEELYADTSISYPSEMGTGNIVLVTGQREYSLPSDLVAIRYPLMENTNGYYIYEWKPGYEHLKQQQQIPANFEGRANFATINPQNDKLYLDYIPTSAENGLSYELIYDKDISVSGATDPFPFGDAVYRALVPCVAELWKLDQRKEFNAPVYERRMSQASRYLTRKTLNDTYV